MSLAVWECCEAEGPGQTKSTGSERSRHSSAVERGGSACTVHTTPRNGRRLASAEAFPYSWTKGIHHVRNMFWTLSSRLLKSTPNMSYVSFPRVLLQHIVTLRLESRSCSIATRPANKRALGRLCTPSPGQPGHDVGRLDRTRPIGGPERACSKDEKKKQNKREARRSDFQNFFIYLR